MPDIPQNSLSNVESPRDRIILPRDKIILHHGKITLPRDNIILHHDKIIPPRDDTILHDDRIVLHGGRIIRHVNRTSGHDKRRVGSTREFDRVMGNPVRDSTYAVVVGVPTSGRLRRRVCCLSPPDRGLEMAPRRWTEVWRLISCAYHNRG